MRRTKLAIFALVAATGLSAAACTSDKSTVASGGASTTTAAGGVTTAAGGSGGGATCPAGTKLAFFGALTGSSANLGINESNGVQLAIEQFNKANSGCQVAYDGLDSAGDPAQAPALAQKAIGDTKLVGIIGPAFSGESKVANPIFEEATLPNTTASATNPSLSKNGWKYWHRGVGNDNAQGPAASKYITGTIKAKKVAVIDEGSEYGKGLADIVRTDVVTQGAAVAVSDKIDAKATDYSSTVNKVKQAAPDAIFFGGYYDEGGRLIKQLRDAGVMAPFVAGDGANDEGFVTGGGAAAEGATLLAPAGDITKSANGADFTSAYKAKFSKDPGLYSVEAFDITNHFLAAIKAGKTDRKSINDYLLATPYTGLTKTYTFGPDGELSGDVTIFAYKVVSGKVVYQDAVK